MTIEEIKEAVNSGKKVYCGNSAYEVIKDKIGQWLIKCTLNDYCIGLTWQDGTTLNAKAEDFFIYDFNEITK